MTDRVRDIGAASRHDGRMNLAAKLQIKPGHRVRLLTGTGKVSPELRTELGSVGAPDDAAVLVAFVSSRAELSSTEVGEAIDAARADQPAWIAYPKAGQLGTDLNRDSLVAALAERAVQPVRQVALDAVWSALRFRPA